MIGRLILNHPDAARRLARLQPLRDQAIEARGGPGYQLARQVAAGTGPAGVHIGDILRDDLEPLPFDIHAAAADSEGVHHWPPRIAARWICICRPRISTSAA